jgi:hypothetical protein
MAVVWHAATPGISEAREPVRLRRAGFSRLRGRSRDRRSLAPDPGNTGAGKQSGGFSFRFFSATNGKAMSRKKPSLTADFENPMTDQRRGEGIFFTLLVLSVVGLTVWVVASIQDS